MEKLDDLLSKLGYSAQFIDNLNKNNLSFDPFDFNVSDNFYNNNSIDISLNDTKDLILYETSKPISHIVNSIL